MKDLYGYDLQKLREGPELVVYRGHSPVGGDGILVLTPPPASQTPAMLERFRHELSLADELDPAWAARPLALLRHEGQPVSNAARHAFSDGRSGLVQVGLKRGPAGGCVLTVRDDGIGLDPALDVEHADSLGLQLVHSLTLQLHGSIATRRERGTTFTIDFPADGSVEAAP